jgi:hypothetical protein
MKNSFLYLIVILVFIASCNPKAPETNSSKKDSDSVMKPLFGKFYQTRLGDTNALVVAPEITYDVVLKNSDKTDDWAELCLKNVNRMAFADAVFKAVYAGKLKAFNYKTEAEMTIEEVKELEKEFPRKNIAKVQFVEEWYFDEENLQVGKKVNAVMLGYELYDNLGAVRGYKAGIKVFLNNADAQKVLAKK